MAHLQWGRLQERESCNLREEPGRALTGSSCLPWPSGCLLENPSNTLLQTNPRFGRAQAVPQREGMQATQCRMPTNPIKTPAIPSTLHNPSLGPPFPCSARKPACATLQGSKKKFGQKASLSVVYTCSPGQKRAGCDGFRLTRGPEEESVSDEERPRSRRRDAGSGRSPSAAIGHPSATGYRSTLRRGHGRNSKTSLIGNEMGTDAQSRHERQTIKPI